MPSLRTQLAHSLAPAAVDAQALELTAPWGVSSPAYEGGGIYIAVAGGCTFRVGERDLRLDQGDALFLPMGEPHALMDRPSSPTIPIEAFCASAKRAGGAMRFGGGGARTRLLTIGFILDVRRPWLAAIPPLCLRSTTRAALVGWLTASAELLRTELPLEAKTEVVRAVMRVVYAVALTEPGAAPLTPEDDRVVRAYASMRREPGRRWTVDALAAVAGMSRSSFAAAFTACLGESPIHHLRALRLDRARAMRAQGVPSKTLAATVGYADSRSLRRALRRSIG